MARMHACRHSLQDHDQRACYSLNFFDIELERSRVLARDFEKEDNCERNHDIEVYWQAVEVGLNLGV